MAWFTVVIVNRYNPADSDVAHVDSENASMASIAATTAFRIRRDALEWVSELFPEVVCIFEGRHEDVSIKPDD